MSQYSKREVSSEFYIMYIPSAHHLLETHGAPGSSCSVGTAFLFCNFLEQGREQSFAFGQVKGLDGYGPAAHAGQLWRSGDWAFDGILPEGRIPGGSLARLQDTKALWHSNGYYGLK